MVRGQLAVPKVGCGSTARSEPLEPVGLLEPASLKMRVCPALGFFVALTAVLTATRAAAMDAASAADQPPTVVLNGHQKVAGVQRGNVAAFLGIPYADPPIASLRWKPPRTENLTARWNGTLKATKFAPKCIQMATPFSGGAPRPHAVFLFPRVPALRHCPLNGCIVLSPIQNPPLATSSSKPTWAPTANTTCRRARTACESTATAAALDDTAVALTAASPPAPAQVFECVCAGARRATECIEWNNFRACLRTNGDRLQRLPCLLPQLDPTVSGQWCSSFSAFGYVSPWSQTVDVRPLKVPVAIAGKGRLATRAAQPAARAPPVRMHRQHRRSCCRSCSTFTGARTRAARVRTQTGRRWLSSARRWWS